jgi:DNA-binding GntR family transcriptional regulator
LGYGRDLSIEPKDQLRAFLREHVSSYEELEALLLLVRQPGQALTESEVATALNVGTDAITPALERLASLEGLLSVTERAGLVYYQFAPKTAQLAELSRKLLQLHAEQRLTLVQMMSANALERVRGAAMRRLADAFKLERPKK